jgi:hypothetical protein
MFTVFRRTMEPVLNQTSYLFSVCYKIVPFKPDLLYLRFTGGISWALSVHMHVICFINISVVDLITLLLSEKICEYLKVVHPLLFQILRYKPIYMLYWKVILTCCTDMYRHVILTYFLHNSVRTVRNVAEFLCLYIMSDLLTNQPNKQPTNQPTNEIINCMEIFSWEVSSFAATQQFMEPHNSLTSSKEQATCPFQETDHSS